MTILVSIFPSIVYLCKHTGIAIHRVLAVKAETLQLLRSFRMTRKNASGSEMFIVKTETLHFVQSDWKKHKHYKSGGFRITHIKEECRVADIAI